MNVSSTAGWQDLNPRMKNRWCRGVSAMFFPSWPGKIRSLDKYVEFCPVARLGVPEISFNFNGEFPVPKAVSKTNKSTRTSVAGGGRTTRSSWSVGDGVCLPGFGCMFATSVWGCSPLKWDMIGLLPSTFLWQSFYNAKFLPALTVLNHRMMRKIVVLTGSLTRWHHHSDGLPYFAFAEIAFALWTGESP